MAYVSLYRKYRPQTFDEVVGQDHVTTTIANAIDEDRLHHAYLFTGPRGTGKTSTARILAKAINCEQGPGSTPCNACEPCRAITQGSSVDVIELDMASHGGVDDARDLRERARFAPASARRKVYILDEVHMASTAAFNALLKLIEEPPDHVIFAMATTDPQKVIPTIMSRVQRFDLRRVGAAELAAHVRFVCESEDRTIEDAAVDAVVRAGDGSVRDVLSVLEQVLSFADDPVTGEAVAQVLGQTPFERTAAAVDAIAGGEVGGALSLVQDLQDEGIDLRRFAFDLLAHLRDLLVLSAAPDRPDLVDATTERREELADQVDRVTRETLLHAVEVLSEAVTEMRLGPPRLPLELALATLASPATSGAGTALADRVARLEQRLAGNDQAAAPANVTGDAPADVDAPPDADGPDTSTGQRLAARAQGHAGGAGAGEPDSAPGQADDASGGDAAEDAAGDDTADDDPDADPDADEAEPGGQQSAEPADAGEAAGAPEPAVADADSAEADGGTEPAADAPPGSPDGDDALAPVAERWDAVLEVVKDHSRRVHAVYEPAEPIRLRNDILTLRYPRRYASFHADNADSGQFAATLTDAVEQVTGLTVRIEAVVEGDDARRPQPPLVGEAAAREADREGDGPSPDASAADGAQLLHPPSPGDGGDAGDAAGPVVDDDDVSMARADRLVQRELDAVEVEREER